MLVGGAEHKNWWRDLLLARADVVARLAGEEHAGRGVTVVGRDQPEEARRGLTAFLAALPAAGRGLGVRDRRDPEQVGAAAVRNVLVRIDLRP